LPGSRSSPPRRSGVRFFLDEGLPAQVGQALALVDYPIETADDHKNRSTKDEDLIPWMAEQGFVWITKDDEARAEHANAIRRYRISVIWVRGLERRKGAGGRKNVISAKELHLMLTVKLAEIEAEIAEARGPRYYLVWLAAGNAPKKTVLTEDKAFKGRLGRASRRAKA
jgi:predicted nuclease of predicted toxin-antitoxin system